MLDALVIQDALQAHRVTVKGSVDIGLAVVT
jgi:hypothetical protein